MVRATTLQKVAAHDEGVWAVAWLPNSTQLLTGSVDESVKLWSLGESSLEASHAYTGHALGVINLDVSPQGDNAITSSLDSMVRVFSIEDRTVKHILERPPTETWQTVLGAVTPESTQLAVAGGSKGHVCTYSCGSTEVPDLQLTLGLPQVCVADAAFGALVCIWCK
jgi:WD repeat-containing protein 61